MSHKHKIKIEKIFEHPISNNINVKKLISALEHYGVKVEVTKKHKAKLFYNDSEFVLPFSHNDMMAKDEVVMLRHWLEEVGLTPETFA